MAPFATMILGVPAILLEGNGILTWLHTHQDIWSALIVIVGSGLLAFCLNFSIFYVIHSTTAVTFNVAGNLKVISIERNCITQILCYDIVTAFDMKTCVIWNWWEEFIMLQVVFPCMLLFLLPPQIHVVTFLCSFNTSNCTFLTCLTSPFRKFNL